MKYNSRRALKKKKKKLFHVAAAWIMEPGGQIKVWLNICGVYLPPLTNTVFIVALLFTFIFCFEVLNVHLCVEKGINY